MCCRLNILKLLPGLSAYLNSRKKPLYAAAVEPGIIINDLPTYSRADVGKHKTVSDRVWVTYKNGVYDVTEYMKQHPGGNRILLAAGGDIEPFWNLYGVHKQNEIYEILEGLRIGNITEEAPKREVDSNDPYATDPARHPALVPSSERPFNAEPPVSMLMQEYITPNELFFVRNHLPVPEVDVKKFSLELGLEGKNKTNKLNLDTLKRKFKKKTVTTTVQCAGNRRSDMTKIKPVKGLSWGHAAISTAQWSGATLNDVLHYVGIDLDRAAAEYNHIQFEGMDTGPDGTTYGASIPLEMARDLRNDIIIAYEMNGTDIPRDHGYPLRIIVPGVVGARQVKWLNKIMLSKDESASHWQQRDYKGFNSSVDWDTVDFSKSPAIQFLPVQSAICEPLDGEEIEDDEYVTVKGYAWSGGGRGINRVDVSADGGKTWKTADLQTNGQTPYRAWAWTFWETTLELPKGNGGTVELVCKACDSQYNVQPDSVDGIWNLRGCLSNAWHRIKVKVPELEDN